MLANKEEEIYLDKDIGNWIINTCSEKTGGGKIFLEMKQNANAGEKNGSLKNAKESNLLSSFEEANDQKNRNSKKNDNKSETENKFSTLSDNKIKKNKAFCGGALIYKGGCSYQINLLNEKQSDLENVNNEKIDNKSESENKFNTLLGNKIKRNETSENEIFYKIASICKFGRGFLVTLINQQQKSDNKPETEKNSSTLLDHGTTSENKIFCYDAKVRKSEYGFQINNLTFEEQSDLENSNSKKDKNLKIGEEFSLKSLFAWLEKNRNSEKLSDLENNNSEKDKNLKLGEEFSLNSLVTLLEKQQQ